VNPTLFLLPSAVVLGDGDSYTGDATSIDKPKCRPSFSVGDEVVLFLRDSIDGSNYESGLSKASRRATTLNVSQGLALLFELLGILKSREICDMTEGFAMGSAEWEIGRWGVTNDLQINDLRQREMATKSERNCLKI
jgi:hypothetical protein